MRNKCISTYIYLSSSEIILLLISYFSYVLVKPPFEFRANSLRVFGLDGLELHLTNRNSILTWLWVESNGKRPIETTRLNANFRQSPTRRATPPPSSTAPVLDAVGVGASAIRFSQVTTTSASNSKLLQGLQAQRSSKQVPVSNSVLGANARYVIIRLRTSTRLNFDRHTACASSSAIGEFLADWITLRCNVHR